MLPPAPTHGEIRTSGLKGVCICTYNSDGIRIDSPDNTYKASLGICTEEEYESIKETAESVPLHSKCILPNGKVLFYVENTRLIYDGDGPVMIDLQKFNELTELSKYVFIQFKGDDVFSMYRCRYIHSIHDIEVCNLSLLKTTYHGLIKEEDIFMKVEHTSHLWDFADPGYRTMRPLFEEFKLKALTGYEGEEMWKQTVSEITQKFSFS